MDDKEKNDVSLPSLSVNVNMEPRNNLSLVKTDELVGYCNEALEDIRDDRQEIDEVLRSFLEMVMNEGDATSASKEAVVNLLKLKSDTVDKKTKIIDILMKSHLAGPRSLAAHQYNYIEDGSRKRNLLKSIHEEGDNKDARK